MATIANGKDTPLNVRTGTAPDVSGALKDQFQLLTFDRVVKTVVGFSVHEVTTPVSFWGLVQPFRPRDLLLLPAGERAWTYLNIFAEPVLSLQVDDVIVFLGKSTRILSRENYSLYGYQRYMACQDWTGSGPTTV